MLKHAGLTNYKSAIHKACIKGIVIHALWMAPAKKGIKKDVPHVEERFHFYLPKNYNILVGKSQVKFELACLIQPARTS